VFNKKISIHEILSRGAKKPVAKNNNKPLNNVNNSSFTTTVNNTNNTKQTISTSGVNQSNQVIKSRQVDNTSNLNTNLNQKQQVSTMINGHVNGASTIDHSGSNNVRKDENLTSNINSVNNHVKSQELKMNSIKNNVTEQITNGMEALKNHELKSGDSTELKRKRVEI